MKKITPFGWAFFGTIGGLVAAGIGYTIYKEKQLKKSLFQIVNSKDFALSLIVLVAAIMKSEGKPMKSEIKYVKKYFIEKFGEETTSDALLILNDLLEKEIIIDDVCSQINKNLDLAEKLQLLHFLFGVSIADDDIKLNEFITLEKISEKLNITIKDYESIKSMYYDDLASAYKILEIDENSTDLQVKQAFRRMALLYHPDRILHLGEDIQISAKEKFQKLNQAYDIIKKERNF
jgi:DnaJ like chaperone protein